jgi:hypothetical protein
MGRGNLRHYPVLGGYDFGVIRSGGPGLGNLLFPIGRALIGCERYGGQLVYPTLRQFKVGPYLRREPDKRTYGRVLRARTAAEWGAWLLSRTLSRVSEDKAGLHSGPAVVCYEGLRRYFHDLVGYRAMIGHWLDITASSGCFQTAPFDLAVHVRLGDFAVAAEPGGGPSYRLPIDWYSAAIAEARGLVATERRRMVLFTDGDVQSVLRELELPGIEVDTSQNALAAILRMARGRVLVASRSTFSMWGTFLGESAAVWDRRFDLETYFPRRPGLDVMI